MRAYAVAAEIEPQHLVDAFDAELNHFAIPRDGFGIMPTVSGDLRAIGAQH
jgi:hypothetical protein